MIHVQDLRTNWNHEVNKNMRTCLQRCNAAVMLQCNSLWTNMIKLWFTFPTSDGPGCRATEQGRLSGNWSTNTNTCLNTHWQCWSIFYRATTHQGSCSQWASVSCAPNETNVWVSQGAWQMCFLMLSCSPQRRRERHCLQASGGVSSGPWCESGSPCPAAQGKLAGSPRTGPFWRTRPSHPCPDGRTERCTTASRTLWTHEGLC